jgi:sulfite reductase beta subunit-like hemoprotein
MTVESASLGTETTARPGSLENPEQIKDVPGHIIPILEREFDDFDTEAARFRRGESVPEEFVSFRLKQGVYGQRQADVHMMRIKLPFGGVTPEQLEAFAEVAETFAPLRKGHITTRQNIQFHHVPLTDAQEVLRVLASSGLSSREACGNTVRNVTGDLRTRRPSSATSSATTSASSCRASSRSRSARPTRTAR